MARHLRHLVALYLFLYFIRSCAAGMIVNASIFEPRYTPNMTTACANFISLDMKNIIRVSISNFGSQKSTVFAAAAGEAIWENGASCGQIFIVSCINPCTSRDAFKVMIVDRASTKGDALLLPKRVYEEIANPSAPSISIQIS